MGVPTNVDGFENADRKQVRDHRRAADTDEWKGMPVIGAIPIVMPTLMKTWNSRATTIPPAAIAEKASRAPAITFKPRQITSR